MEVQQSGGLNNGNDPRKGKVCVTGASGYLASWLIKKLLESGYFVIGTVRNPDDHKKLEHLRSLEGASERLKLVYADLKVEGSFDEAIMGCQGVFHTASPVTGVAADPKGEIVEPAVEGTLNVLRSCKRNQLQGNLKRVVITSSTSALRARDDFDPNLPLDESSWSSTQLCESLKIWYALSKTLAEKAAWGFAEENGMDLVTVLPAFVIGPSLSKDLSSTAIDALQLLKGDGTKFSYHGRMGYVHIDDVVKCHILAYENPNAQGRYLCCSTIIDSNQLVSVLSKRYPSLPIPSKIEEVWKNRLFYEYDTSKVRSLGIEFKSIEEMFDDCVASFKHHGYI